MWWRHISFEKWAKWRYFNTSPRTVILAMTTAFRMGLAVSTDGRGQVAAWLCPILWSAASAVLGDEISVAAHWRLILQTLFRMP